MSDYDIIIFAVIIIIVRLIPILLGKGFLHRYSYDSGWYFLFARHFFEKRNFGKNILDDKLLIESKIENPSLYPIFISYFFNFCSIRFLKRFFNIYLDIFFILSLYFIFDYFAFSQFKIFLLLGLYAISPIFYSITNLGPRLYAITPRLLSEILFTYLLFLYYAFEFINPYFIILYLFVFTLILYLSKFTLQVLILLLFPSMVLNQSYDLLSISFITFLVNIYFSKTLQVTLKGQYQHLRWYVGVVRNGLYVANRNSFLNIFKSKNLKSIAKSIYRDNSYLSTIIKFIPFFFIPLYSDFDNNIFFTNIILVSFILFILINTKYFIFLGEAERYIVHAFLPVLIIIGFNFTNQILIYFLCFYFLIYLIELFYIYKTYNKSSFFDYDETYKYLEQIKSPKNILLNPLNILSGFEVAARSKHNIFNSSIGFRKDLTNIDKLLHEYPIVNLKNLKFITSNYGIDILILSKDYFNRLPKELKVIIDNYFKISFISSNGIYMIYDKK